MSESIQAAPPDPILGITEAFQKDPRDGKINLSVGVFKDESGATPVLPSVKEAEKRLLEQENNKLYKPIQGDPAYGKRHSRIEFGRQALHAEKLALVHPATRRSRSWRADPPADMQELIAALRGRDASGKVDSRFTIHDSRR